MYVQLQGLSSVFLLLFQKYLNQKFQFHKLPVTILKKVYT